MALSTKLVMRQGQSLVMTPQLLQAIKLLQFSNLELAAFVEEELERNPLLERVEEHAPAVQDETEGLVERYAAEPVTAQAEDSRLEDSRLEDSHPEDSPQPEDWTADALATDRASLEHDLGTEFDNVFEAERTPASAERPEPPEQTVLSASAWSGPGGTVADGETTPNLEAYVAARATLHDHLAEQLGVALADPVDRLVGGMLIDLVDDAGYLTEQPASIALRLGVAPARVERVLAVIQGFDPTGVGARDLAECLAIQLRDRNRFDPAMQALVGALPLLAKRDFAQLRRLCSVDDEDLMEMVAELRSLDPKPGRAFGTGPLEPVVADVFVRPAPDGTWHIELNTDVLPRVLVNQTYYARVAKGKVDKDKSFVATCLQTANWLTKSLEQRARTILKVASEIVRRQDAFLAQGVEHLKPLNLKTIADAIGMHESTVSRVTSNKYMATPRGLLEMKYFFTASIASSHGGDAHSAEAVRFRIKQMIDGEAPHDVLSDDAIVLRLRQMDVDIARRTVAKYRESLRIPSSVARRREKQAIRVATG